MVTTLLASMMGFMGSIVPEVFRIFQDKRDRAHELKIMELQIEQQRLGHQARLEEIRVQGAGVEAQAIYQTYKTGVRWVDALNGTVRPVLAYAFFLLYAGVKAMQFALFDNMAASVFELVTLLWGVEDQAIFAAIISFYYGQRAMQRCMRG